MHSLRLAGNYLLYFLKALDEHSLHSPLIYNLYSKTLRQGVKDPAYDQIEQRRSAHLKNHSMIAVTDFGAGTSQKQLKNRKISSITKKSVAPAKKSQLLHRLIKHFQPKKIIELGTCLGLNTLYLALEKNTEVFTFEGCLKCADKSKELWKNFEISDRIHLIEGNIDNTLPKFVASQEAIDFVFMDANHTYEATLRYFNILASRAHQNTVIIIDDIYWSAGMKKAWQEIQKQEHVFLTIDLFYLGIVLFKPLFCKQHYILEY